MFKGTQVLIYLQVSNEFYNSLSTDLGRLSREFYTPEPISRTGNYWPRLEDQSI